MARPANPELRVKILKAAAGIIEDCGPDCVTMREVAEKIGYSSTTLYLYFKDKNDILREAVLLAFDDLAEAANAAMVGPTNLDKFRQRCRGYVMWGITNPGHYQLMFESNAGFAFTGEELKRSMRGMSDGADVIRAAIAAGELPPPEDPRLFADASWAAIHGATSLAVSRRLIADRGEVTITELADIAFRTADALVNCLLKSVGAKQLA